MSGTNFLPAAQVTPAPIPTGLPQTGSPLAAALMGNMRLAPTLNNPLGGIPLGMMAQMMMMRGANNPYGTSNATDPYAGMAGLSPQTLGGIQANAQMGPNAGMVPGMMNQGLGGVY